MKFNVDITEGDRIVMNNRNWFVEDIDTYGVKKTEITLRDHTGDMVHFTKDELQQSMDFSGRFEHIGEEYDSDSLITP